MAQIGKLEYQEWSSFYA